MRKNIITSIPVIAFSITFGYLFLLSLIFGFVASKYGGGKSTGQRGRIRSILIPCGRWRIHLHHWLCSVGLIGLTSTTGLYLLAPSITYGLLGGMVFQGIYCYNDWHRIICSKHPV